MDKENMVYIHNGTLVSHQKEWNPDIRVKITEIGSHYIKWKKWHTES